MILNTQIHKSVPVVEGEIGFPMGISYFDGKDFKTQSSTGTIKVALNSIIFVNSMYLPSPSSGLVKLYSVQGNEIAYSVWRVTENFWIS